MLSLAAVCCSGDPLAQEPCSLSLSLLGLLGVSVLLFTYGKCSPEQSLARTHNETVVEVLQACERR